MAKNRKKHTSEQIVPKLGGADVMLNAGKELAPILQSLEVREQTYYRWRNQSGGRFISMLSFQRQVHGKVV